MGDSSISDFEDLALKGQHIYALTLQTVYPMKWSAFIRFFKHEEQKCVNETFLSVDLSYN